MWHSYNAIVWAHFLHAIRSKTVYKFVRLFTLVSAYTLHILSKYELLPSSEDCLSELFPTLLL